MVKKFKKKIQVTWIPRVPGTVLRASGHLFGQLSQSSHVEITTSLILFHCL